MNTYEVLDNELETQYSILIKAHQRKEKQRYNFILFVLFITLVAVGASVFFSYKAFAATQKSKPEEEVKTQVYYQTLSTIYNGGPLLNLTGIGTGYELKSPKVIQVTNEGTTATIFDIKIQSIKTSLLSTNNLVYTITQDNETSNNKQLPLNDQIIISDIKIEPNETKTFTIKVKFNGTTEQGDYSNYYNAHINIEQKNNKSSLME